MSSDLEPWFEAVEGSRLLRPIHPRGQRVLWVLNVGLLASIPLALLSALVPHWLELHANVSIALLLVSLIVTFGSTIWWYFGATRGRVRVLRRAS